MIIKRLLTAIAPACVVALAGLSCTDPVFDNPLDPEGTAYAPVSIEVRGPDPLLIEVGSPYVDSGVIVRAATGADLSGAVVRSGDSVSTAAPDTFTIMYSVSDGRGYVASCTRTVIVVPQGTLTASRPRITLLDGDTLYHTVNTPFVDPGATATAANGTDLTARITVAGTVNDTLIGTYVLTYSVSDGEGNQASRNRIVRVISGSIRPDTVAPVITILGSNPAAVEQGAVYIDDGATAYDAVDGDLSVLVQTRSTVNTDSVGVDTVMYWVTDRAGNRAEARRLVIVSPGDKVPPVITLVGANPLVLTVGATFTDPGATAVDETDGDISARIQTSHNVNTSAAGSYTVTYTVSDAAGNRATRSRTVTVREPVVDTIRPVITLLGDNPLHLAVGAVFRDPGATATDNVDGNLTARIQTSHNVNTAVAGSYTVTYTVSDAAGNTATAARSVIVSQGGTVVLTMNVNIPGDNTTTYTFAKYSNPDGWTPDQIKIVVQPLAGGQVSGSITVNGTVYQLTSQYYNAIVVPNTGGTVRCSVTGTFQIGLGL